LRPTDLRDQLETLKFGDHFPVREVFLRTASPHLYNDPATSVKNFFLNVCGWTFKPFGS
jgi:hypothetical protein